MEKLHCTPRGIVKKRWQIQCIGKSKSAGAGAGAGADHDSTPSIRSGLSSGENDRNHPTTIDSVGVPYACIASAMAIPRLLAPAASI